MIFREVTQGTQLYLLDRLNVTVGQCPVASVSKPHFDPKMLGNPPSMVVDVTIDVNGVKKSYVLNEGAEFGTVENILMTPNRDVVIRELQSIQGQAEADLKMVDRKKETIEKCKSIIKDIDPSVKERMEMEGRISSLENSNKELLEKMGELLKAIKNK